MPLLQGRRRRNVRFARKPRKTRKTRVARRSRITPTNLNPGAQLRSLSTNSVFPASMRLKLYAAANGITMTATAGVPQVRSIMINSLRDPFQSFGAEQPRWFDTLMGADNGTAPYGRYLVHGAKVSVTFYPVNVASSTGYWRAGLCPRIGNSTAPSSISELMVRGGAVNKTLTNYYSQTARTITKYVSVKKWWNRKDIKDNSGAFGAAYNADPTNPVYLDVLAGPVAESGSDAMFIDIKVVFYAELYSLNDVADS